MTNENKNLGNDDFKTQDNFSTENHVFHDEKKEHGKDDFERQDAFDNKPKTSVKNIDIGKTYKIQIKAYKTNGAISEIEVKENEMKTNLIEENAQE